MAEAERIANSLATRSVVSREARSDAQLIPCLCFFGLCPGTRVVARGDRSITAVTVSPRRWSGRSRVTVAMCSPERAISNLFGEDSVVVVV